MGEHTQHDKPIQVFTPLGKDVLLLARFSGEEGVSRLFHFTLEMVAENHRSFNFDGILGQRSTVRLALPEGNQRYINGIVTSFSRLARGHVFTEYRMELAPQLWLLNLRQQSRIFQRMNVPDILKKVLEDVDLSIEVQGRYERREYCVQYRETDFDFASRLMEEEGMYYFFKHSADGHKLVIADSPQSHPDTEYLSRIIYEELAGGQREDYRITSWEKRQQVQTGKYILWDHKFELPHKHLDAQKLTLDSVQAGRNSHKLKMGANSKLEIFDYPGGYAKRYDGIDKSGGEQPSELQKIFEDNRRTTDIRMQQEEVDALRILGASNCLFLAPGYKFNLERHYSDNGGYVVTSVRHEGSYGESFRSSDEPGDYSYKNEFECIPAAVPFRPRRITLKPVVRGSQTAVVVGPAGEEIFTDKYSRIKVQFHWDRDGKYDADSSCWVRVASNWAGKNWGFIAVPRIGQEVIVDFLEGDPDQPIVVGSVYNAEMMPPYKLPDNKTQTGIRSRSSKSGSPANYNEIRFEDLKGKELVTIHAEKDELHEVENDSTEWVGHDRFLTVDRDQTELVKRHKQSTVDENQKVLIKGDSHLHIKKNHKEKIDQNFSLTVGQNQQEKVGQKYAQEAGQEIHIKAGMKVIIEAGAQLTIKGPGGFVDIGPAGVTIKGTMVLINSGGAAGSGSGSSPESPEDAEKPPELGSEQRQDGAAAAKSAGPGSKTGLSTPEGGSAPSDSEVGGAVGGIFGRLSSRAKEAFRQIAGERYSDGIRIKGPKEYRDKVRQRLDNLKKTESGKKILAKLDKQGKAGKGVTIVPAEPGDNHCRAKDYDKAVPQEAKVNKKTGRVDVAKPGKGTGSTVGFNPDYEPKYPDGKPCRPPEVGLGHELIHASHNGDGANLRNFKDKSDKGMKPKGSNHEEAQTIGRGAYRKDKPSDNSLRKEMGYKPRTSHASVCP